MATDLGELQNKLWEAADQLRANSGLKASEYASPVLGLIFLRYADERFAQAAAVVGPGSDRRPIGPEDYKATGALYLPERVTIRDAPQPSRSRRHREGPQSRPWAVSRNTTPTSKVSSRRTTPASPMASLESSYGSCGHYRKRSRVTGSG